jgi:hypothetical protein
MDTSDSPALAENMSAPAPVALTADAPPVAQRRPAIGLIVTVIILGVALLAVSAGYGLFTLKARDLSNQVGTLQTTNDQQAGTLYGLLTNNEKLGGDLNIAEVSNEQAKAAAQSCIDAEQAYVTAFVNGANATFTQAGADAAAASAYAAATTACGRAGVVPNHLTLKTN